MIASDLFLQAAIEETKKRLGNGGIPIGAVPILDGEIIGREHNQRIQKGSPTLHAEMYCLKNTGRLSAADYRQSILYSTLSPYDMCSGAILLYKIPTVIVGENRTFSGPEDYLPSRGVDVQLLDNRSCFEMMENIIKSNPDVWLEDIGEPQAVR